MRNFEFTIIASGFGLDENFEDALFEAGCDDATLSFQKGVLIAEFDREAVTFSNAVASAVANIRAAGWKVERVEPDHLVSISEIAERSKLSRQAISLYVKGERLEGFPSPSAKVTSKHPLWDWYEVAHWLHKQNHIDREIVIEARIVKEANVCIAANDIEHDGFYRRLESCEAFR
jgi:transcriptional regulator with XRE-family HTH domain